MIKKFIVAIVLLTLLSGGLVGFNLYRDRMMEGYYASMTRPPVPVSAQSVDAVTWKPVIEAFGTLGAARGVELAARAPGVVQSIAFDANGSVEEGALLVQLDDRVEQADLGAAQAAVTRDQQALDRATALSDRGVGTTASLQDLQAALAVSKSQLLHVQAVLDQKAIRAPFAGTIGIPRVEIGQFVTAGTVIASLQDLSRMRVDFTVREQDFDRLSIGQPITAGLEGSDAVFSGKITGIDPRVDPSSRLVSVRAEVEADGSLHPGGFVRVAVSLPEEQGVLALPQTAIVSSLYGDFVYRVEPAQGVGAADEKVASQVFVTTGRRSGPLVEIVKGLAAGDMVVSVGQNRISNGAAVTIQPGGDPGAPTVSATALPGAAQ